MARRYTHEVMVAATADHARGVQAPIVCQRYGISERTLYRWSRAMARARAETGPRTAVEQPVDEEAALLRSALALVLGTLPGPERLKAIQLVRSRLQLSREAAARLFPEPVLDEAVAPRRVGVPLAQRRPDSPVAAHFGAAPWLGVYDAPSRCRFVRNAGRSGIAMLAEVERAGCTDLIVIDIGFRVRDRLDPAQLRVWRGVPGVGGREHLHLLEQEALEPCTRLLVTLGRPDPGASGR